MHPSIRAVLCFAAVVAALAGCGAATTCPAGETGCGGTCVDLQTDALHCGACDVACGLGSCSASACACDAGASPCTGPGFQCVDLQTDPSSCGTCGHACLAGDSCAGGACVCPGGSTQTMHPNGLGQSYYDCAPLDQHTLDQARLAAAAWAPDGQPTESGLQCGSCLCRTNGPPLSATKAAVWCYAGSSLAGFVRVTDSPNCLSAFCPILGQLPWR